MARSDKIATVFGGTGFIGRQVVRELAKLGVRIKVATRVPERAYFLRPSGNVGQIVPFACDYKNNASIGEAVADSDYVVNCIGILHERKKGQFEKIHAVLPGVIARACAAQDVERFVHISALGADKAASKYARTKLEGEKAVRSNFPKATILRPSVVFGEDDSFFNMFAELASFAPALPLIGGGRTKFQPVYVGDVADAVLKALTLPAVGKQNPQGRTYELGGPEILDFRDIYAKLFRYTGLRRPLVNLPWGVAKLQARLMRLLPNPPLTPDQVVSLRTDNTVDPAADKLADLGISPTDMDIILPTYLERFRPGGRFSNIKAA